MLKDSKPFGSFSVGDLERAKDFYQNTLGLDVKDNPMGLLKLHFQQDQVFMIYPRHPHQPANFTVLNFQVKDIDKAVKELSDKGVKMETYDNFNHDDAGIARGEGPPIAWFKDPDGNILSLIQPTE